MVVRRLLSFWGRVTFESELLNFGRVVFHLLYTSKKHKKKHSSGAQMVPRVIQYFLVKDEAAEHNLVTVWFLKQKIVSGKDKKECDVMWCYISYIYDIWYMIYDIWFLIYDIWYMICDMWYIMYMVQKLYVYIYICIHVVCDTWHIHCHLSTHAIGLTIDPKATNRPTKKHWGSIGRYST